MATLCKASIGRRYPREDRIREFDAPGVAQCIVREERGGAFYLVSLKVHHWCQNKGVGAYMLRTLKSHGRRIYLMPVADDPEKQNDVERFYKRHGFHKSGKDYVEWNPLDAD